MPTTSLDKKSLKLPDPSKDSNITTLISSHYRKRKLIPLRWMQMQQIAFILSSIIIIISSSNLLLLTQAFNVDTQFPVVHKGPDGSYFGFAVAQHPERNSSWLLIGAPKAQTSQPNVIKSGAVYKCTPTNPDSYQQIVVDPNGSNVIKLKDEYKQADDKSYQWFGASLHSSGNASNGHFIACAPRYVSFSFNLKRRDPIGTCWVSRGRESFGGYMEYSPCRLNEQWGHHNLGYCQAGFSSAISKDGNRIFMGAPGAHVWQGQVFAHDLVTELKQSTRSLNPHSEDDYLLGYSIALGRFSSRPRDSSRSSDTDLAIGIPRALDTQGRVMIVDSHMETLFNLTGEQVGSRFGEQLAVADINADGRDDLLVGAPYFYNYTERHQDRGAVYVYVQTESNNLKLIQRIYGKNDGGRLGSAIAAAGDLNKDGFTDIAIGAPYDGKDKRGSVYIYLGKRFGGFSDEPDQIIEASSLYGAGHLLRGFGYSISGGLDLDSNEYPDLLVGAYASDRAVVLRSRPVVNANASLTFEPRNFNLDEKNCAIDSGKNRTKVPCIEIRYCTKYSGINVGNELAFTYDIKLDTEHRGAQRLFFLNEPNRGIETRDRHVLTRDRQKCHTHKVYISSQIRDKLTPIKVVIEYGLEKEKENDHNSHGSFHQVRLKPILNKNNQNKLQEIATIQKYCGADNICVPDLKLSMKANVDEYTIGSNKNVILDVTVKNHGEDAFESMFYLTMPASIDYKATNKTLGEPICFRSSEADEKTGSNVLTCDLGNPLGRDKVVKFSVITEPARGEFNTPDFTFEAHVNSTNPELNEKAREDNQVAIGIPIKVETNLIVSGQSIPQTIYHNLTEASLVATRLKTSESDIGQEIYHVYQLHNRGPSTISDIALSIFWPTRSKDGSYLLYLVDEPLTDEKVVCRPSPKDSVNPLHLRYVRGDQSQNLNNIDSTLSVHNYNENNNQLERYRRQAYFDSNSINQQQYGKPVNNQLGTVDLNILKYNPQFKCRSQDCSHLDRFDCNVINLGNNEMTSIRIRSRLYMDNPQLARAKVISSEIVAQIKLLPHNVSTKLLSAHIYDVETHIHMTGLAMKDMISWWLILLAILLGITLLALLAWCLKMMGFFERRRPPKTNSAQEREPLTSNLWNDYHYTPGDTAL